MSRYKASKTSHKIIFQQAKQHSISFCHMDHFSHRSWLQVFTHRVDYTEELAEAIRYARLGKQLLNGVSFN